VFQEGGAGNLSLSGVATGSVIITASGSGVVVFSGLATPSLSFADGAFFVFF